MHNDYGQDRAEEDDREMTDAPAVVEDGRAADSPQSGAPLDFDGWRNTGPGLGPGDRWSAQLLPPRLPASCAALVRPANGSPRHIVFKCVSLC